MLCRFLYVDILDCTGTMYSMARYAGAIDEETQDFEGSAVAYLIDAFGVTIGSLFGCPPVTAFVESGAGISEGGATGLTSITTGLCFFIAIFFAPIFASIPPWATGCTLIIVGSMMAKAAAEINWSYMGDAIPAFLTITMMPFTYSIADGLIAGIVSYIFINTTIWLIEKASGGRIKPADKHLKDPWTYKLPGGILPPWVNRAAHGKKDFWKPHDEEAGNPTGRTIDGESNSLELKQPQQHERPINSKGESGHERSSASSSDAPPTGGPLHA
jgi:AGZA family xanthine/uracil permease-like MFS transporter